jgi:hypothetical protein
MLRRRHLALPLGLINSMRRSLTPLAALAIAATLVAALVLP